MERCRHDKPCCRLACSVCLRSFRIQYLDEHLPIWEDLFTKCSIYSVSAICRVPVDTKVDSLIDFKKWFFDGLRRYGFDSIPLIGGIDYSYDYEGGSC